MARVLPTLRIHLPLHEVLSTRVNESMRLTFDSDARHYIRICCLDVQVRLLNELSNVFNTVHVACGTNQMRETGGHVARACSYI
jgi:hypothetical protein